MRRPLLLLLLAAGPAAAEERRPYTMADLKSLDASGSAQELLDHADEVPQAKRPKEWRILVAKSANAVLAKETDKYGAMSLAEAMRKRYPALMEDVGFRTKRKDAGLGGLAQCYAGTNGAAECTREALTFVKGSGDDTALALDVAKIVARNQSAPVSMPFMVLAAAGAGKDAACFDEDLVRVVAAALGSQVPQAALASAKTLAATCFDGVKDALLTGLDAPQPSGHLLTNACPILMQHKALSESQARKCKKS